MRIGIDLLWVRHGICGGTESVVRNLIQGFGEYDGQNEYILFVAQDNEESFREYLSYGNMAALTCPVKCAVPAKRILWENLRLDKMARDNGIDVMFIPVYSKPRTRKRSVPYVSVIYDLQALHYPQYFSFVKRMFYQCAWRNTCRTSEKVITASDFCKEDLILHYPCVKDKILTIYAPVISRDSGLDFALVAHKYGIKAGEYYYCVTSLLPHKNLETILKVAVSRKSRGDNMRLVISGVGGEAKKFDDRLRELGLEDEVVQTGFVSDEERDCLYENCSLFLFPSIFEGFGMPPIEAMRRGKNVVMTGKSCLREVTEGRAYYVEDPFDVQEWIETIKAAEEAPDRMEKFERYELRSIIEQYAALWNESAKG